MLGFALMAQLARMPRSLSARGYHHHLGANTWESRGASPPAPETAALRRATILLGDRGELERVTRRLDETGHEWSRENGGVAVRDPSRNLLFLVPAEG